MNTAEATCKRLPAEWEAVDAILLAWPHKDTDWNYILDEVRSCYAAIIAAAARRARVITVGPEAPAEEYLPQDERRTKITHICVPTNDTWIRDYGTITTVAANGSFVFNDFKFNGWGLKFAADKDNLVTLRLCQQGLFNGTRANRLGFVLEGGSIESDGKGTLLTTEDCLLSPNRNGDSTKAEIESYLTAAFGLQRILWLGHGALEGDDTDGHIDTLARLAPDGDVIFFTGCHDEDDTHYAPLLAMRLELEELRTAAGQPYHLIELPLPDAVFDPEDGHRLPATYANFLFVNGAVLLPVYGQPMKDRMAVMALQAALPDYEIVPVDCSALIRQHGSLHCATMQIPYGALNKTTL